ncbi:MAG: hypothetical protein AB7N91_22700 [Candidatus Tectimicrobiota bacterium]
MDPTAAWQRIVTGIQALAGDPTDTHTREELVWALQGLATWLDRGGLPPDLTVISTGTTPTP